MTPLNCDRDATRWAREFNEVLESKGIQPLDPSWLLGWFANAMMCGEDTYRWRKEKEADSLFEADGEMIHQDAIYREFLSRAYKQDWAAEFIEAAKRRSATMGPVDRERDHLDPPRDD